MGTSSTRAKRKYNAENYGSIHVWLEKSKVDKFKAYAKKIGMSQSAIIEALIDYEYIGAVAELKRFNDSIEQEQEQKRQEHKERDAARYKKYREMSNHK